MTTAAPFLNKKGELSACLTGLVIAFCLLVTLLPVPRALAVSSQPWIAELTISGLLLVALSWIFFSKQAISVGQPVVRNTLLFFGAFVLFSLLSSLWANSAWAALHHTFEWVSYLATVSFSLWLMRRDNGYRSIVYGLGLTVTILAVLSLIDFISITEFTETVEGMIRIRYGKFGEMAAIIAPFVAGVIFYARSRRGMFLAGLAWLFAWLVVMLCLSKGAFLAGIIGHVVCFGGILLFSKRAKRSKALIALAGWVAITVGVQLFFSQATAIPSTTSYISGAADKTRGTSEMRLFTWRVGSLMVKSRPLLGVGGDNFGIRFNEARTLRPHTDADVAPETAEDYVVERAHNEPLQILAELGIVGFILFALVFAPFKVAAIRTFFKRGMRLPPIFWASVGGMIAFAASSMVSSFSFRVAPTGVVFFLVFSIALNEIARLTPRRSDQKPRALLVALIVALVFATLYFGAKGFAERMAQRSERSGDAELAQQLYRRSLSFDTDNGNARYFFASLLDGLDEPAAAAVEMRKAIDHGLGVSLTYDVLAKYQEKGGDLISAESTFAESLRIFPNSVYLRVAHACFLERTGRSDKAFDELNFARRIDLGQANGWHMLITRGSVAAYMTAQKDTAVTTPAELLPANAVPQYVDDPQNPRPSEATP